MDKKQAIYIMASASIEYVKSIAEKYKTGQAREHSYRPALQKLFGDITGLNVINEPKRSEFGAPDFIFTKGNIVLAYAEAKDIDVALDEVEKSEQMIRYYGYSNIILTNSLEFRFFKNGEKYGENIEIAEIKGGTISPVEKNFSLLEDTIVDFIKEAKEPIKSGALLAKVMAGKARRIRDNIKIFLKSGDNQKNESLLAVYGVIKKLLLADLDYDKFADMYAQTVVYGLFAARYHDKTPDTFSRQEARDLVPKSNPFLLEFFNHIAGPSFDKRIEFIVNELCEEFTHADIQAIVHDYYKVEKDSSRDPIIHFYEDFLQEYDAGERKKMGVFYTPLPVVNFIVRSIDAVLKKDFGLKGLADSSLVEIPVVVQGKKSKIPIHKVQILDPATGTGTFLNSVILFIKNQFSGQEGRWSSYVKKDLLPRLHGFEIMMASYTIAHLKLSTTLKESGADINSDRLGVYLTNSLEKAESWDDTLFAGLGLEKAITEESHLANKIKNDLPIMVVLGNPPYSVSSSNKGDWIMDLIKDYKVGLDERNIQALSDDYIKFIRFAEYLIEKNGEGVIGMITNNSYIDGIIHRQMRKKLLEVFDYIYILDLHGNSSKKEKSPDGSKDENVFNIQQGVAISILVRKTKKKEKLGAVFHADLYGKREHKFEKLNAFNIEKIKWQKLICSQPGYFFTPKDFGEVEGYEKGFKVDELFTVNTSGVKTHHDKELVGLHEFEVNNNQYLYRPLDMRWINYDTKKVVRHRFSVMKHMLNKNLALCVMRQFFQDVEYSHVLVSNSLIDERTMYSNRGGTYLLPLYLYSEDGTKTPNLKKEIIVEIEKIVGKVTPENIFDYIYAVLHSPSYREKYKEFLKIDFPRVPYPKDKKQFFELAKLGEELRHLHLLESPKVDKFITTYPVAGDDLVEKVSFDGKKVYLNKTQYFGGVPEAAWNFYIGGYQPAQKWLKDRKGRKLDNPDIEHYQKMIVAMNETIRIMGEIDKN